MLATQSKVAIYNADESVLIAQATGSVTIGNGAADESVGYSYSQCPIDGSTGDQSYFDGKIYEVELWLNSELYFPSLGITWDPSNKGASLLLSNGNLTVYREEALGSDWEQVLATEGKSSGKWYFEVVADAAGTGYYSTVGVQDGTVDLESHTGQGAGGYCIMDNARFYNNNAYNTAVGATWYVDGDVVMVALDLDNGKIWFGKNGTWLGLTGTSPDPETGTDPAFSGLSGTYYPVVSTYFYGAVLTGCFSSEDLTYTPPTGFSPIGQAATSGETTEPDLTTQSLGFSEAVGFNIVKIAGVVAGIGFGESSPISESYAQNERGFDSQIALSAPFSNILCSFIFLTFTD